MKKKIHKLLGVALTAVLLVTMTIGLVAVPASAGTLSWSAEVIPSPGGKVIEADTVNDMAVASDGTTIYAALTTNKLYKSTNGGVSWAPLTSPAATGVDLVAIAPDDDNMVVVVDAAGAQLKVYVSINGGSSFASLDKPEDGSNNAVTAINCVAISPSLAGIHYITVGGNDLAGASVHYFNYGATPSKWLDAADSTDWNGAINDGGAGSYVRAVAFSPNFASDRIMTVVSYAPTQNEVQFQIGSFAAKDWNTLVSGYATGYPVTIDSVTVTALTEASIAFDANYLGADSATRLVFVGTEAAGGADVPGGIYRLNDFGVTEMKKAIAIKSVAYDTAADKLIAGNAANNYVYRCANPTATVPTVTASGSTYKKPGVDAGVTTDVIVAWAGGKVVAGSGGTDGGFSVSNNDGQTFNDISLVQTAMTYIRDVAISADGSKIYLVADDGAETSLWRYDGAWERVLAIATTGADHIVRPAPEDFDVVYLAEVGAKKVYYSSDAGETKWMLRYALDNIQDIAVESASVLYAAASGAATVRKSINGGFIWGGPAATKLAGGNCHMIKSLGEDKLIVASTTGYVSYSTNGGSSWTPISPQLAAGAAQVTADGLDTDDYIYGATAVGDDNIYRWQIGTSTTWTDIISGTLWHDYNADTVHDAAEKFGAYGLALHDGVLYAVASTATDSGLWRCLSPSTASSTTTWSYKLTTDADDVLITDTPWALTVTSGSIKLWAPAVYDSGSTAVHKLYSFTDTLTEVGPTPTGPADGATVAMNPVTGRCYDVPFTWDRLSTASSYDLYIALDSGFTQVVWSGTVTGGAKVVKILGPFTPVATPLEFMPNTTYYWHVRVDSSGPVYSPWSATWSFTVAPAIEPPAPPAPVLEPELFSPAYGATGVSVFPTFAWSAIDGAIKYELEVAKDVAFTEKWISMSGRNALTTSVYISEQQLDYATTYYWRVDCYADGEWGDWVTGIFTTEVVLEPVVPEMHVCPLCGLEYPTQQALADHYAKYHAPAPAAAETPMYMWVIIGIGAVLVITMIILIVRTRRAV